MINQIVAMIRHIVWAGLMATTVAGCHEAADVEYTGANQRTAFQEQLADDWSQADGQLPPEVVETLVRTAAPEPELTVVLVNDLLTRQAIAPTDGASVVEVAGASAALYEARAALLVAKLRVLLRLAEINQQRNQTTVALAYAKQIIASPVEDFSLRETKHAATLRQLYIQAAVIAVEIVGVNKIGTLNVAPFAFPDLVTAQPEASVAMQGTTTEEADFLAAIRAAIAKVISKHPERAADGAVVLQLLLE